MGSFVLLLLCLLTIYYIWKQKEREREREKVPECWKDTIVIVVSFEGGLIYSFCESVNRSIL